MPTVSREIMKTIDEREMHEKKKRRQKGVRGTEATEKE